MNFARSLCALFSVLALGFAQPLLAGPGAHGPDGEHLNAPGVAHTDANASPMMETQSETFELVATLREEELSVLIDRFATNEPVIHAKVEVEIDGIKAAGTFHADHADYAFTDEKLLAKLREPGQHPLVFTIQSGNEADLLSGTLSVGVNAHEYNASPVRWLAIALGIVLFVGFIFWLLSKRRQRPQGDIS
ncbi:MAG TPA: hypothetical protein VJM53_00615 [Burkholderiales bacterium]|nr:hypothetical protein [Burkholderiales bacterium]